MKLTQKMESWADAHHPRWLDYIRMILGGILFIKGMGFLQNREAIEVMLQNSRMESLSILLAHYVASAHLVGGVLIGIGLLTRLAILFQIPILLGAIFFVNAQSGFFSGGTASELEFSILVLGLLVFFLFYGSGPISIDNWMKTHKET